MSLFGLVSSASAETLEEALISAYNSNPRLMAERARIRELDENYVQAKAQGLFSSSASGSIGASVLRLPRTNQVGQPIGGNTISESLPISTQLQVVQPIYQGGRVKALKEQAKSGILAAREGLRGAEQNLFLTVATAYRNIDRDEQVARIRRNNIRVLAKQLQAAEERFAVGDVSRTDIAQAEARLAAADIGLAQADAQLQMSRAAYARAVGHVPAHLTAIPEFIIPKSLAEALALARENNPQVIAAVLNERAATAAIGVAKAGSKPLISINGTVAAVQGQDSFISKAQTGSLTAQISIPIFSGGINRSRVRAAGHARTRASFETRDIERAVDENVIRIWSQLDATQRSLVASMKQVEATEFAFEGVELEQQLGARSTLDVLNAEQEVLDSRLSVINAQATLDVAKFQLLVVMGGFDAASLQVPVDLYDPKANFDAVSDIGYPLMPNNFLPERLKTVFRGHQK